jgi:hypothetical protein
VSHAAPAPPEPDDDDDDVDELLDVDSDVDDDEALEPGAVVGSFLSLLHAATSPRTHNDTRSLLMTVDRR